MADNTTELEVLDQIVDVLGGQSGQYETVVPTLQQILALLGGGGGGGGGGYNPSLSVGRADALTGADETAQWATRESTGSGSATVRSVQGAAVAWNQLIQLARSTTFGDITINCDVDAQTVTINGATGGGGGRNQWIARDITVIQGHKYLFIDTCNYATQEAGYTTWAISQQISPYAQIISMISNTIFTANASGTGWFGKQFGANTSFDNVIGQVMLFDLTQMFGSGNEPTTVAEFEAMYPEPYYPYSEPTLKPVQIAGIASKDAQGGELDAIEWTAQTLRAAGSIRDELTETERIERVRVVNLGTLTWTKGNALSDGTGTVFYAGLTTKAPSGTRPDCNCAELNPVKFTSPYEGITKGDVFVAGTNVVIGGDSSLSASEFKASMSGVILYAQWATPTITPISPALPMTYKVEQGGSENIIVPEGEVSAAPLITLAEGESAAELVMDALACIAAPDGPTATANHAINTYLTMGGKLYKVTTAIASGEQIVSGTNVTETTVMAELLALAN